MDLFEDCWKFDTFKYFMIGGVIVLMLLLLTPNPIREKFAEIVSSRREHRVVSPSELLGSDRGTYRGYWGAPKLYDQMTGYKCACHAKNKILREGKCYKEYDRGGIGLEEGGLPLCNTAEGYANVGAKLRGIVTHNIANAFQ